MNGRSPGEVRQGSIEALKMVYYVVIGLAIIEALARTFLRDGDLVGFDIFVGDNLSTTLLFVALTPTICRFVHGASIHLLDIPQKGIKPLLDFWGFFIQASLFYLMATALNKPFAFVSFFGIMLAFDALWILVLASKKYISLGRTEVQWLISDLVIIISFVTILLLDSTLSNIASLYVVCAISVLAAIVDYWSNSMFYFPTVVENEK